MGSIQQDHEAKPRRPTGALTDEKPSPPAPWGIAHDQGRVGLLMSRYAAFFRRRWWLVGGLLLLLLFTTAAAITCDTGNRRTATREVSTLYCLIPPLCVPVDVDWHAQAEAWGHGHVNTTDGDGIPNGARSTHLHQYNQSIVVENWYDQNLNPRIPVPVSLSFGTTVYNRQTGAEVATFGAVGGGPEGGGWTWWGFDEACKQATFPSQWKYNCLGWDGLTQMGVRGGRAPWSAGITLWGIVSASDGIDRQWALKCPSNVPC